ncbi:amidohydrolase family protein [Loigolactobacillus jiayinensis]|uniref:Amidohydrolase family protein n=1 Tax=Loigolactobacillus jiayinensis TaxID=2486016 RepID=A0ABW1RL33_9LACO|nr:amidohydrolase family protein [Loigolactobacillus jiayinensis]
MKLITVEEHFDTPANIEQFNAHSAVKNNNPQQAMLAPLLTNFAKHIEYMDQYGIDMQVVSDAGNSAQVLPDELTVAACQVQNDTLAESIAAYPDRFAGLATLPVNVPDAAAQELERAVTKLGLKGGIISGTINGQFLDDPKFETIFAMAAKLEVPLYLHPGVIPDAQKSMLYDSKAYDAKLATFMGGAAWGWHMEQGVQMVRLIISGLLEKYPTLKLVSGHWGEFVPMFMERLSEFLPFSGLDLPHEFSYYYKRNVYITPSGMYTAPQLQLARTEMGADHLMYSEDFPYIQRKEAVRQFITTADLTEQEREQFAHGTAEKLFKLAKCAS